MGKYFNLRVIITALVLCFTVGVGTALAFDDEWEELVGEKPQFSENGDMRYRAVTKAYVSGIRYRSVGFNIRLDVANGVPRKDNKYTFIWDEQMTCVNTPLAEGMLKTECTIPKELVKQQVVDLLDKGSKEEGKLYISPSYLVSNSRGELASPSTYKANPNMLYHTLQGFLDAAPWSAGTRNNIPDWYDYPVPFKGNTHIHVIYVDSKKTTPVTVATNLSDKRVLSFLPLDWTKLFQEIGALKYETLAPEGSDDPGWDYYNGYWKYDYQVKKRLETELIVKGEKYKSVRSYIIGTIERKMWGEQERGETYHSFAVYNG